MSSRKIGEEKVLQGICERLREGCLEEAVLLIVYQQPGISTIAIRLVINAALYCMKMDLAELGQVREAIKSLQDKGYLNPGT